MTRKEALRQAQQMQTLQALGFTADEAESLRRISMTLQRWHEMECGTDNGCIDRADDGNGAPYWMNANSGKSYRIPDRDKGARKRLAAILGQRNGRPVMVNGAFKPCDGKPLSAYVQTDPRGAALYIIRPGDVPAGADVGSYYSRGICVY